MTRHTAERTLTDGLPTPTTDDGAKNQGAKPHMTAKPTQTVIDQPHPLVPRQRRRGAITAVVLAVVLVASAVAWSVSTDGSPGAPSDRPDRSEAPSLLESPAEFDRAIADAIPNSDDDSIMHNGAAFDRAVQAAR